MKILIVCNGEISFGMSPFVIDFSEYLMKSNIEVNFLTLKGNGIVKYLKGIFKVNTLIRKNQYDLVHSFYGLTGVTTVFQKRLPVIVSLIGSDVHIKYQRFLVKYIISFLAHRLIFVSNELFELANKPLKGIIIPLGVDMNRFMPIEKEKAKSILGWHNDTKYVLFSSSFDNKGKNSKLAFEAVQLITNYSIKLVEIKDINPEKLPYYFAASELILMTSLAEGSPQVIKEALSMNIPIVSTDVGDVKELISGIDNCHITNFDSKEIGKRIVDIIESKLKVKGRERLIAKELCWEKIINKYITVYEKVISDFRKI